MDFGQYVRKMRKEKGISARELARRANISQAYLSQLETGKYKNPTKKVVISIAKGLGISRAEPLRYAGYLSDEDYKTIQRLRKTQKLEVWEDKIPIYHLDKLLKGEYLLKYNNEWLTNIDKEKLIKFIETFILEGSDK